MTDQELMQMALEVLERCPALYRAPEAATALRERLAQPEQEPVDNAEKASAYLDARLWEFIDMAAAWPEAKPDPRTWEHVLVYAPKQPEKTNQCAETCERAKLCATCAKSIGPVELLTNAELCLVSALCTSDIGDIWWRGFARAVEQAVLKKAGLV